MKNIMKTIAAMLTLCLLTFNGRASLLLHETFPTDGTLTNVVEDSIWTVYSGNFSGVLVNGGKLLNGQTFSDDTYSLLAGQPYAVTNSNPTNVFYATYSVNFQNLPTASGGYYIGYFKDPGAGNTFKCRLFALTNGAASGSFRLGLANAAGSAAVTNTTDLSLGTTYTVVMRYINLTNGPISTLWINPVNETSPSLTATDATTGFTLASYAFRQPGTATTTSSGTATLAIDDIYVGTTFADVVPGSVNPPSIVIQPVDNTTVFSAGNMIFTNLAVGDPTINYQWYYNTNTVLTNNSFSVSGATNAILTLTNLTVPQSGTYSCVSSNAAGTNVTRYAVLLVNSVPVPPTIDTNTTPALATNFVGDTVTFTVVAHGLPVPAYQWKFVPSTNSNVTNIVVGLFASGTNTATLTLTGITTNQAGSYFVTITNNSGYLITNSAKAVLTVNPTPIVNISTLHAQIDPVTFAPSNTTSLYKVRGIVTTWSDMTSVSSTLFYIQDGTGGIPVFWSGANGVTNLPPPGALVEAVGTLSSFSGLLELNLVYTNSLQTLTIISTNTPASIPRAQPLPIDPLFTANIAAMKQLEGSYFVVSNVYLLSEPTFVNGREDLTTNIAYKVQTFTNSILTYQYTNGVGQTFIMFVNSSTDIGGKPKPFGPVTMYGVLGYHAPGGFEFTPSRYADIISYNNVTNVLTNARKGDLATNAYTELVLRPGETLNTLVSVGDAAGGSITLTPVTAGLPGTANWSGVVNGLNATAKFAFAPSVADSGTNYLVQLGVSSTAGTAYTYSFTVYVPTTNEQQMAISEFLANPTTNTAAPHFNPLKRATDTTNITSVDQYIEVANFSAGDLNPGWTLDYGDLTKLLFDSNAGAGATISSSNSLVIYSGAGSDSPGLATPVALSTLTGGLGLLTSGGSKIILRNGNGYIIDRMVYAASDESTNGSLTRFPTINSAFVPQAYVSTNHVTPGAQYDGVSWASSSSVPQGLNNVTVSVTNNQVFLKFTADITKASTLWRADNLTDPFTVVNGSQFSSPSATFSETNLPAKRFYYISTQQ